MTNQSKAMDEIAQYLQEMNFKESIVGGYNKEDVLLNIRKLNAKFQQMLEDSQKGYDALNQQVQEAKGKEEQYENEISELKERCAQLEEELRVARSQRVINRGGNLEDTRRVSRSILEKAKDEAKGLMQRTKEETNRLYWENKNRMDQELQEQQKILEYLDSTKNQWLASLGFMETELDNLLKTVYSVRRSIQNDESIQDEAAMKMNSFSSVRPTDSQPVDAAQTSHMGAPVGASYMSPMDRELDMTMDGGMAGMNDIGDTINSMNVMNDITSEINNMNDINGMGGMSGANNAMNDPNAMNNMNPMSGMGGMNNMNSSMAGMNNVNTANNMNNMGSNTGMGSVNTMNPGMGQGINTGYAPNTMNDGMGGYNMNNRNYTPEPQEDEIDLEQEWQKVIQGMDLDVEGV